MIVSPLNLGIMAEKTLLPIYFKAFYVFFFGEEEKYYYCFAQTINRKQKVA